MIVVWLIIIPLLGGLAAWLLGRRSDSLPRWASLASLVLDAAVLVIFRSGPASAPGIPGAWMAEFNMAWLPALGIGFHLAIDGLSLILVALTLFLGILSVISSWTEIRKRVGFFHLNIMAILSGVIGVFLSLDLFLFYFFWELMLVPMYFLISIWGHENKAYASLKFFIFTQAGGLFLLLSILGLYFTHAEETGIRTFDYPVLLSATMPPAVSFWLMLGFIVSFIVKLPAFPFHPWLPDAHTQAPTAGSVILAGLLLKTGAYGLIRFVLPLFPDSVEAVTPAMLAISVTGIVYGASLAFAQTDLKRLVAYSSVSHMGFVLLGIFAGSDMALQGSVMQMVAHGVSTGALFIIVGLIQERIHTRDLKQMGGFWSDAPRLGAMVMVFSLASLGLPGSGNFVGEFMVLAGGFKMHPISVAAASTGLVFSAVYALWIIQRAFHGERPDEALLADTSVRETGTLAVLVFAILWLGLFPGPVLKTAAPGLNGRHRLPPAERIEVNQGKGNVSEAMSRLP